MRRIGIVAVLTAVVAVLVPATPASAVTSGAIAFTGTAHLPVFPCTPPPPFGNGPCQGTLQNGQWHGHATGTYGSGVFDVSWTTTATNYLQAGFTYYELQCFEPSTLLGHAVGSGTAYAGPGAIRGSWQPTGATLPRDITEVSLSFDFVWTRIGTQAAITFTRFALWLNIAGTGPRQVMWNTPPATATFVPQHVDEVHPPSCAQPLRNVQGTVAGEVTLAG